MAIFPIDPRDCTQVGWMDEQRFEDLQDHKEPLSKVAKHMAYIKFNAGQVLQEFAG